jgi:hypothetical protein
MLRKTLIVTLGFLGVLLAGTAAGSVPASAGYACGPWNAWCGRAFWLYPGWGHGRYGDHRRHHDRDDWRRFYSQKHWNGHPSRRWN